MRGARAVAIALVALASAGCGQRALKPSDAQAAIAASRRFRAPQTQAVRSRYCAAPAADGTVADVNRLRALQDAGAVRVDRHAAAADECAGIKRPVEAVVVTLTPTGDGFHPQALDGAPGWEFPLATRKLLSAGAITYNQEDPPTLAHMQYQWAWVPTLLGQLMQVSDAPQNSTAAFRRAEGEWQLADVGF